MDERKDGFRNWTMLSGVGRLKDGVRRSCMKLRKLKVASRTATGGPARTTGCLGSSPGLGPTSEVELLVLLFPIGNGENGIPSSYVSGPCFRQEWDIR